MIILNKLTLGLSVIAFTSMASATVITSLEDATNGVGFFGKVTFTNATADTVSVTADISDPINAGITQGDILGLWFDLGDFASLTGGPTFGGGVVIKSEFGENSVGDTLDSNVNLNGTGATNWDLAVQVGENGGQSGFNQFLSFDITWEGLDEAQFTGQRVGMRVQSITGITGYDDDEGSSKLTTEVPEPASLALLGLGLAGLGFARRKTKA